MVAIAERPMRMLVVHDRLGSGFWVAMVSADLPQEQIETTLHELEVDGDAMLKLAGWRMAKCGVKVARVPFPESN